MPTPDRFRATLITEDQEPLGPIEGHIEAPKSVVLICDDARDPQRSFWLMQERSMLRCERLRDGRTEREWAELERAAREVLAQQKQQQAQQQERDQHQARVQQEEAERQARAAEGPQLSEEERRAEWQQRLAEAKARKSAEHGEGPAPAPPPAPKRKPRARK